MEQGAGVRRLGKRFVEDFQRDIRGGIAELLAQQVPCTVDRPHTPDTEQTLNAVTAREHIG
ncbi:hypothetical protein D9M69_660130 [compost metagenome]